jgi:sugar/nucleoside kinase (ribokinase family)
MNLGPNRDFDVLVVGDANPDLILRGDVVPRFGQSEQLLESADLTVGGSGAIVAHGLARLGVRTGMVAVIGDDQFGALTRIQLSAAGIDTSELRTDPERPTGLSVILTHGDSRSTLTLIGSIAALDPAGIDQNLLRRARHLHASSFFLQPQLAAGLADLFRRAHEVGTTTSLDTNLDPADRWDGLEEVLGVTDVLLPNRTEILALATRYRPIPVAGDWLVAGAGLGGGDEPGTGDEVVAAARVIAAYGPLVVVKDGERGAVAVVDGHGHEAGRRLAPGSVVREAGHPVAAIDSTGAGDSFDAAFLAARLRGLTLSESLIVACRAGALSTLGIGGVAAQATAAEVGLAEKVPLS